MPDQDAPTTDSVAEAAEPTIREPRLRLSGPTVFAGMAALLAAVFFGLCLPIAMSAWGKERVPIDSFEVVAEYPHDSKAFTQGLIYADLGGDVQPAFFESTGLNGRSSLRRVDPTTGKVLQKVDIPKAYFAEGMTILGRKIYQLTWQAGKGFIYDARTFDKIGEFPLPADERTGGPIEGWGLTTDGESLIISDGSYKIRFLDPETFRVTKMIQVRDDLRPIMKLNELEYMNNEIWANVWGEESIVRISPKSGVVRGYVDLKKLYPKWRRFNREAVLNGIAFDPKLKRIFVTGKLWPKIYEIRVVRAEG